MTRGALTFSLASLMQFCNNSTICSSLRQGSSGSGEDEVEVALRRRMAEARAARACSRSSWSLLEPKKNCLCLVGEWSRFDIVPLCLGLNASDILRTKKTRNLKMEGVKQA